MATMSTLRGSEEELRGSEQCKELKFLLVDF